MIFSWANRPSNDFKGDAGYQDAIECIHALAKVLNVRPEEILIESTGVIGHRIKKEALLDSLPKLVGSLSSTIEGYFAFLSYSTRYLHLFVVSCHDFSFVQIILSVGLQG